MVLQSGISLCVHFIRKHDGMPGVLTILVCNKTIDAESIFFSKCDASIRVSRSWNFNHWRF